ncbi:polysaccharide deacetylase family protein [Glaciecola sp. MH2013]|uniref:polysaccharide deacetylase family protein n=1 Tax=Glaciecola sp. MH2013 TaxID=2785524 RepID=UPI00189D0C84|nr:polysaccharide deacetylase family protein [Glaciecola sp. MH2013]MBF7074418.1 polysaccharide deacetylase family protein [Glaciecola sp. MH2013]
MTLNLQGRRIRHFLPLLALSLALLINLAQAKTATKTAGKTATTTLSPKGEQQQSFVILQYHHVSSTTPRVTSTSPDEFEAHMAYLNEHATVMSLDSAINRLKNRLPFPKNAVAITFDDGFDNILENGHPILRQYQFPYTIFINPDEIGVSPSQLNWNEVKQMSEEGVLFANHTLDHIHLLDRFSEENDKAWLVRIQKNIESAEAKLMDELGYSLKWLAYPFGEFSIEVKNLIASMGYVGFGQQSGAVGPFSDITALPRYPAAGSYAKLESLRTKIHSLAMPITGLRPSKSLMQIGEVLEKIELETNFEGFSAAELACYFKGKSLEVTKTERGFSIQLNARFTPGRTRVNCTAPSSTDRSRYYWYSIPFFTAQEDGTFLD